MTSLLLALIMGCVDASFTNMGEITGQTVIDLWNRGRSCKTINSVSKRFTLKYLYDIRGLSFRQLYVGKKENYLGSSYHDCVLITY